jgi:hypothetical protein
MPSPFQSLSQCGLRLIAYRYLERHFVGQVCVSIQRSSAVP